MSVDYIPFRPENHPLSDVTECPNCHKEKVSLPAYPGDYFDCEDCGHSWKPTRKQVQKMKPQRCFNCGNENVPLPEYPGGYSDCDNCGHSWRVE